LKIPTKLNFLDIWLNFIKEAAMNNLSPEMIAEINRQRIKEEVVAIRLQEEAAKGQDLLSKKLAALGSWMVDRGEKLRKKHSAAQTSYSEFTRKVA
jgi:RNA-binding protein YhbY